ncbi:MAG: hypothetical protein WDZ59_09835 [Pirellulales bacterium]
MKKLGFLLVMLSLGTFAGCAEEDTTTPAPVTDPGVNDVDPVDPVDPVDSDPVDPAE